ncbi:DUF1990 family protein [Pseudonocardia hierapolitana]|uniref:DUF1990 family protein n=1 Tax=Pseudonocardia hierapolitana TaxID=1128676 RepID=UPI001FE7AC88|nr:DUF1990 family protein [Pseudonocardia hierapolitana]
MSLRHRPRRAPGSLTYRAAIVLGWPLGLARVAWRYMWRTTPMRRTETVGDSSERPWTIPDDLVDDDLQRIEDGVGPLVHRRYSVRVAGASSSPEEVIGRFSGDPNCGAPAEVAVFVKVRGTDGLMCPGDEFLIRMPGPWDGPVRVVGMGPASFRLATLRGHLEAGQIEFRCRADGEGLLFEIESWARSGDRLSHLLYTRLRLAKEIQLNLWVETCLRLTRDLGGRPRGGVRVETHRVSG